MDFWQKYFFENNLFMPKLSLTDNVLRSSDFDLPSLGKNLIWGLYGDKDEARACFDQRHKTTERTNSSGDWGRVAGLVVLNLLK